MVAPHNHVISVTDLPNQRPEYLAPLTDAGLTPYRGMKKLRDAGKLGSGRTVVINGIGGLVVTPCSTPNCSAPAPR